MDLSNIKDGVKDFVNYGVPLLAFAGSVYSVVVSKKSNKLNEKVLLLEKELNELQLDRIKQDLESEKVACIDARIIKIGKGKYQLRIWNSGKARAYNVDYYEKDGTHLIMREDVPYEFLDSGKSFNQWILIGLGVSKKIKFVTTWKDENGMDFSKDIIVSL